MPVDQLVRINGPHVLRDVAAVESTIGHHLTLQDHTAHVAKQSCQNIFANYKEKSPLVVSTVEEQLTAAGTETPLRFGIFLDDGTAAL